MALRYRFPTDAEYELRAGLGGKREDGTTSMKAAVWLDGKQLKMFDVDPRPDKPRAFDARVTIPAGDHQVVAAFPRDPAVPLPADTKDLKDRSKNLVVDYIEIRGPYPLKQSGPSESQKRIFTCGHFDGKHEPARSEEPSCRERV